MLGDSDELMALAAGLLGGNRGFGGNLSQGLLSSLEVKQRNKKEAEAKQARDLQNQMLQMQLQQQQTQQAEQQRQFGIRDRLATSAQQNFAQPKPTGILPFDDQGQPMQTAPGGMQGFARDAMQIDPMGAGMNLAGQMRKESPFNKVDIDKFDPASVAKFQQTNNYADLKPAAKQATGKVAEIIAMMDGMGIADPNERRKYLGQALRKETHIADDSPKPPQGYQWGQGGTLSPIKGGPADPTRPGAEKPNKPDAGYMKQLTGVTNVRSAIQDYKTSLEGFSALDIANPSARAKMGTVYNNLMLQAKEAYNLGVLNGPDYMILQQTLTNPMSLTGTVTSKGALKSQADILDKLMAKVGEGAARAHNQPNPNTAPKNSSGWSITREP